MSARVERVQLVSPYALSVPGGVQAQVRAMAVELDARGVEVVVCSPGDPDEVLGDAGIAHVVAGGVASIPANGSRAPVTLSPRASRTFASIAATLRGGVVHAHEPFAPVASYGILRAHRRPVVGTFHRGGGGPAYVAGRPVLRVLASGLDVSTAVSEYAATTIRAATGIEPNLLFNGIDVELIRHAVPRPTSAPTVLFVGRHEERKGLRVLLEALGHLDAPLECWVLGAGPQTASLRARFAADPRVSWLGRCGDAEKYARLRGADVLCVPSLGGESFGLVPLEGMAAGTAVVASDIAGYRESCAGHARLVAPNDPVALAAALSATLAAPPSVAQLAAAEAHAASRSMASLVDRYLDCYAVARDGFEQRHSSTGSARRGG